jgi:hypothetical protein
MNRTVSWRGINNRQLTLGSQHHIGEEVEGWVVIHKYYRRVSYWLGGQKTLVTRHLLCVTPIGCLTTKKWPLKIKNKKTKMTTCVVRNRWRYVGKICDCSKTWETEQISPDCVQKEFDFSRSSNGPRENVPTDILTRLMSRKDERIHFAMAPWNGARR